MSVESMAVVLNMENLDPVEKLILLGIANHDGDGGSWPSIDTLARYSCRSRRTVQSWLDKLVEKGLVERDKNAGGTTKTRNDRRPNLYTLRLPDGVQPDCTPSPERGAAGRANGVQSEAQRGAAWTAQETPYLEPSVETSIAATGEQLALVSRAPSKAERDAARKLAQQAETARLDALFERFWQAYPRKLAKPKARESFLRAVKNGAELTAIGAGLRAWCEYWSARNEPEFVPHATTWLNQQRWNDRPPAPKRAPLSMMERAWLKAHPGASDDDARAALSTGRQRRGVIEATVSG